MNLAIKPELERMIRQRMESGRYGSAEDVVAAALCSLDQHEKFGDFEPGELDSLLAEAEAGGPAIDGQKVFAELRNLRSQT